PDDPDAEPLRLGQVGLDRVRRIDEHRLARLLVAEEVGRAPEVLVDELPEEHCDRTLALAPAGLQIVFASHKGWAVRPMSRDGLWRTMAPGEGWVRAPPFKRGLERGGRRCRPCSWLRRHAGKPPGRDLSRQLD